MHTPRRRARPSAAMAVAVVLAATVVLGAMASSSWAGAGPSRYWRPRPASIRNVLHARTIGRIRFGESPDRVRRRLDVLLSHRPSRLYRSAGVCQIDAMLTWPGLVVFFFHHHFVGYSYRPVYGSHRGPTLATASGLRVGDPLAAARRLYGRDFHASRHHGGSWWATTPQGRLEGLTSGWPDGPRGSVATIAAGLVGCPALAP